MELNCTSFRLINTVLGPDDNDTRQIITAGDLSFICSLHFDTDTISDTYNHWICSLEVVSDTEDIPERSFVLYPNTLHFEGDTLYTVGIVTELEEIGHDSLQEVYLVIGVPSE
jgi:hypothetical protein